MQIGHTSTSFDPSFSTIVTWFLKFSVFQKGMNHITMPTMELLPLLLKRNYFQKEELYIHNNGGFALILLIGQCTPRLVPCD